MKEPGNFGPDIFLSRLVAVVLEIEVNVSVGTVRSVSNDMVSRKKGERDAAAHKFVVIWPHS